MTIILKVKIVLSRNFVVMAQAPKDTVGAEKDYVFRKKCGGLVSRNVTYFCVGLPLIRIKF